MVQLPGEAGFRDARAPLLRMSQFYLSLPEVLDVRDVWTQARALHAQGIPPTRGEARLLRQVTWSMLQVERAAEEGELFRSLAIVAALVLAVIEDDELELPDSFVVQGRLALEALALELRAHREQLELSIGAAIGSHDIRVVSERDLAELEERLQGDPDVQRTIRQARIHLRQGEELLGKQHDAEKAAQHRVRLRSAADRAGRAIARLLAVAPAQEPRVIRGNIVRRELKQIEIDALGVVRLGEAEQSRRTRELLSWTEADLGETLTEENKARLSEKLRDAAASDHGDDDSDWLSDMQ